MSPEIKAQWERAVAAAKRGDEIRKKATDEKRDLTAEELVNAQKAFAEYRELKLAAEVAMEAAAVNADLTRALEMPLFGGGDVVGGRNIITLPPLTPGSFSKRAAIHAYIRGGDGRLTAELKALLVSEGKAFGETSNEAGGYLLSEEMANFILVKRVQANVLRARCTVIPTRAASFRIPTFVDESNPAAVSEGGTVTETSILSAFGKVGLTPAKHSLLWKIDEELLDDAPTVEAFLQQHFVQRSSVYEEDKILNGAGGQANPIGLLAATWTQTHDISGAADAISEDDFVAAPFKLTPAYRRNAVWILPTWSMQRVAAFRSKEGGEGTGVFLWLPSFALGQPDTILGKAVLECEAFASPAADGDPVFLFGDLSTYYIADRTAITIQRLTELYAASGQVGFRLKWRWDGAPSDDNAFVRYNRK